MTKMMRRFLVSVYTHIKDFVLYRKFTLLLLLAIYFPAICVMLLSYLADQ